MLGAGAWLFGDAFRATPDGPRATLEDSQGPVHLLAPDGQRVMTAGGSLLEREWVRTPRDSRATLRLRDGSRVEMKPHTELGVSMNRQDVKVHLERGSIIVHAAEQRRGHLIVATDDARVVGRQRVQREPRDQGDAGLGAGGQRPGGLARPAADAHGGTAAEHHPLHQWHPHPGGGGLERAGRCPAARGLAQSGPARPRHGDGAGQPGGSVPISAGRSCAMAARCCPGCPRARCMFVAVPNDKDALDGAKALIDKQMQDHAVLNPMWQDKGAGRAPAAGPGVSPHPYAV